MKYMNSVDLPILSCFKGGKKDTVMLFFNSHARSGRTEAQKSPLPPFDKGGLGGIFI